MSDIISNRVKNCSPIPIIVFYTQCQTYIKFNIIYYLISKSKNDFCFPLILCFSSFSPLLLQFLLQCLLFRFRRLHFSFLLSSFSFLLFRSVMRRFLIFLHSRLLQDLLISWWSIYCCLFYIQNLLLLNSTSSSRFIFSAELAAAAASSFSSLQSSSSDSARFICRRRVLRPNVSSTL